ncbi:MAG: hypothetical protein M1600_05835 [Firmicutes bacterium]|jgi:hypothetical protein|nr:hypothetical protein [Bacillota bacterium]
MNFFDLLDTGILTNGPLTPTTAESHGQFDAANGYSGVVAAIGEISQAISTEGSLNNVVTYLTNIANNYKKGFPSGIFCYSFNNQGANATVGTQAAKIQNALVSNVGALAPFLDAEADYASSSATITMVDNYNGNTSSGLFSDLGYYETPSTGTDWNCTTLQKFLNAIGGTGVCVPQNYCDGNLGNYTACGLSGFFGVTVWDKAAENIPTLCGTTGLGYQGGIDNFKSTFGSCPQQVLLVGGSDNNIDASKLTC